MRPQLRLPSASTAVALLALFVAFMGTGYAAVKINGRDIKARTISGKKLRNDTVTGRQIREARLGTMPRARAATHAGTANGLGAGAAAGIVRRGKVLDTDVLKLTATGTDANTSPLKTVFKRGPFSLQAACWDAGGGKTALRVRFTSTEAGSIVNNMPLPLEDTEEEVSSDPDDAAAALAAPSGATLFTSLYRGIKSLGADCLVDVTGVASP
jgi:hypothetical protein